MRVSQNVLAVLDRATCQGNALSLTALGQIDRKLYADTNRALEAAGGTWNRKAKAHLFDGDAAEAIEPIILTGEIVGRKVEFQQFDSPPELAARVIVAARIDPRMKVLEPSAGLGNLAVPAIEAGAEIHTYEVDPRRSASLTMRIAKLAATAAADSMGSFRDFLSAEPEPIFDRVVMNPPFAGQADIRHVLHAANFLKPGGRLVAIMSAGIRFRQNRLADQFRAFLVAHDATIDDLPADSFKASGTSVRACIVAFDAPEAA